MTVEMLTTSVAAALVAFVKSLARAVVPLLAGLAAAVLAGAAFIVLLSGAQIGAFFSDASAVGTGVLIALVVNGSFGGPSAEPLAQEVRAGTIALSALGTVAALIGQLATGSTVLRGVFFAAAWGGMTAGVLGLVFFVRGETATGPDPAARLALSAKPVSEEPPTPPA